METTGIHKTEKCFPYEYDKEGKTSFATEKEWFEAISNSLELITINDIKEKFGVKSNNTIISRIKPNVRHIVLNAQGLKGESNVFYDKKDFLQYILQPGHFRRRSLFINPNEYSDIIPESTRVKIKEFLALSQNNGKNINKEKQALMQELEEEFYPFFIANCPSFKPIGNKYPQKIWEQCPPAPCTFEGDIFATELHVKNPNQTSKNYNKSTFEAAMIEFAPFGYTKRTKRDGTPATERANTRLFIKQDSVSDDHILVGYEAWCQFYQEHTGKAFDAMAPLPKPPSTETLIGQLNQAINADEESQAKQIEAFETMEPFLSLNKDILINRQQYTFISGEAGTGKTVYTCYLVQKLQEQGKNILLCATTGAAAHNINLKLEGWTNNITCHTVHAAFKLEYAIHPFGNTKEYTPQSLENILASHVIIIDEISMLRMDNFTEVIQKIKQAEALCATLYPEAEDLEWLTHKQIILVGDFCQLPPVISTADAVRLKDCRWPEDWVDKGGYCFFAPSWQELNFKKVILEHNFRQAKDPYFLEMLKLFRVLSPFNEINANDIANVISNLNTRLITALGQNLHSDIAFNSSIHIVSTNDIADCINTKELRRLPSPIKKYAVSTSSKKSKPSRQQLEDLNIAPSLKLKVGALVIANKNDPQHRYFNGSRGIVTELGEDYVKVRFDDQDNEPITIKPLDYNLNNNLWSYDMDKKQWTTQHRVSLTVKQFPLQLAYAITIHKSQGMTFDSIILQPRSWAYGQFYTALSRIRSLNGLYLQSKVLPEYISTSPEVIAFYNDQELSISPAPTKLLSPSWEALGKTLNQLVSAYLQIREQLKNAPVEGQEELRQKQVQQQGQIMELLISKYTSDHDNASAFEEK